MIVGPPPPSTPRHKKSTDGPRVDQIIGKGPVPDKGAKSTSEGETNEDQSMMGRVIKVEKQVGSMDKKLDFLVNVFVQRMGIPHSETKALFDSKEPYPAPPYISPEDLKEKETIEEPRVVKEEKEEKNFSAAEAVRSEGSVKKDPLLGQSLVGSAGSLSGSQGRASTSWQHQLQHPLSQPAWNSSVANTPSPVGGSGEQSPSLYRLPPPPTQTSRSHAGSSPPALDGSHQESSSQSRRRNRRQRGRQAEATVAESDTSVSIPSVDHEELERSFSGFSISQAKEEFFGPPFFSGAGASLCARVKPYLAQAESDTDSELYTPGAPSPLSFTGDGCYGERPWPGFK
ncbi:potassium voltage-gated channel subfamily KQT member 2-like [Aplochiton taeniatus]